MKHLTLNEDITRQKMIQVVREQEGERERECVCIEDCKRKSKSQRNIIKIQKCGIQKEKKEKEKELSQRFKKCDIQKEKKEREK